MLYKDWDILLTGTRIRIMPMEKRDEEAYGRLMFGEQYDRFVEALKGVSITGIEKILEHTESDETHAIRLVGDDRFIGWITLQKDPEGRPDIGISLIPEFQNNGIGPEAVALFANRLYSEYAIQMVYVRISDGNIQSQKACSKLGAVLDKKEPNPMFVSLTKHLPEDDSLKNKIPNLLFYHIPLPVHGDMKL